MLAQQLEEFQYKYGDPRLHFFNYIRNFPNFTTYLDNKITTKKSYLFTCRQEAKKRILIPPIPKYLKDLQTTIESSKEPIVIIPFILKSKVYCRLKLRARHLNIILYNKITNEVERLDIRKYHLEGFSLKHFILNIITNFIPNVIKPINPEVEFVPELDVPIQFIKKLNTEIASNVFPIFLLSYLKIRSKNPKLTSNQVIKEVLKLKLPAITKIWDNYCDYNTNIKSKCDDNKLENPESGRCLLRSSINKLALEKPPIQCESDKIYSSLLNKCVFKNKITDVNILLDDILQIKTNKKEKELTHMSDAVIIIGAMNFIMSKYPYAKFLVSEDINPKYTKNKEYQIGWKYNKKTNEFKLIIYEYYWDFLQKAITNPQYRFLLTLVHIESIEGGIHANVLIYDKDTNEIERFDGLGRDISPFYHITEFDKLIKKEFANHVDLFPKMPKYYTPLDFCPKFPIFQSREIDEIPGKDLRGNCAVWRMWYINIRLANPNLKRKDLILLATKKLEQTGSLYKFIKSYHKYIVESVQKK
jgi:hypothetical protein